MSDQNIRVCCRFRPVNNIEKKSKGHKIVAKVGSDYKSVTIGSSKKQKSFNFDYIFPSGSDQATVFNYAALPLVNEVLAGYNCTLFAYGQTGSGKTYSMEGVIKDGHGDRSEEGLIPRMVREIFDRIYSEESSQFEYTLRVSFVEIYNEKLRDLLQPNGPDLKIREKQSGAKGVYIENVHAPYVGSPDEVFDALHNGHVNRSVASTRMNEHSSRSHAVFMLQLDAKNTETGSSKASKLMLVDLAGSEKVRKTNATGQTLKEAKQINKSLMVLGLVINCLVEKKKHVPYRDSKLTRLLSDALGGNSKTCLLVTASPSKYNQDETVSTLRFGSRAKSIKNEAKINQELSVSEYKKLLERHKKKEEIHKEQIRVLQSQNELLIQQCNEHNVDISRILKTKGGGMALSALHHHADNNTTALVTMVPSQMNQQSTAKQIEALQAKLEAISDAKNQMEESLDKKREELEDVTQEKNEYELHLQEATEQYEELDKRYQELFRSHDRLDKLFKTLSSGDDAQSRFQTEKRQWQEDRLQFVEELRTKENKIEEFTETQTQHEATIQKLRQRLRDAEQRVLSQSSLQLEGLGVKGPGASDHDHLNNDDDDHSPSQSPKVLTPVNGTKTGSGSGSAFDVKTKNNVHSVAKSSQHEHTVSTISHASTSSLSEPMKAKIITLRDTAKKLKAQNEKMAEETRKLRSKLKAYKTRDEVNKQLRENWNKQLNQMEQAVLLANEIYNRERTRHEAEIAEKDVEILKLRKFLLSFTNRHAKGRSSLMGGGGGGSNGSTMNGSNGHSRNGSSSGSGGGGKGRNGNVPPGARASKIVKPKVIGGGHKGRRAINPTRSHRHVIRNEQKSED